MCHRINIKSQMDGIGVAYGKHTSEAKGSGLFLPFLFGRN